VRHPKQTVQAITTRRDFCRLTCQAASLAALGSLVSGCSGSPTSPDDDGSAPSLTVLNGTVAGGVVSVNVGAGSPLASVGGAALIQSSGGSFLAARTGQNTFMVLTAVCTHEGCTVSGFQNSTCVCPCHGSQFATSGSVVRGPASQALRQFSSQFANDVLTFTT
jgi:Rieske Fe-S protein